MKKSYLSIMVAALTLCGVQVAAAQFPRIPKVEVPKVSKPKTEQPTTAQPAPAGGQAQTSPSGAAANSGDGSPNPSAARPAGGANLAGLNKPEASGKPVLLKDTL